MRKCGKVWYSQTVCIWKHNTAQER